MTCLRVYGPTLVASFWLLALVLDVDVVLASAITAALFIPASVFHISEMKERIRHGHPGRRRR